MIMTIWRGRIQEATGCGSVTKVHFSPRSYSYMCTGKSLYFRPMTCFFFHRQVDTVGRTGLLLPLGHGRAVRILSIFQRPDKLNYLPQNTSDTWRITQNEHGVRCWRGEACRKQFIRKLLHDRQPLTRLLRVYIHTRIGDKESIRGRC